MQNTEDVIIAFKRKGAPVRLSYPALFEPKKAMEEGGKPKFGANFILDKKLHAEEIKQLQDGIKKVKIAQWKKEISCKTCLRDGAEKGDKDGYGDDVMFVSASNDKRPGVVDRDLTPLTAQDGKPYAGCYVYCTFRLWAQDNKFGKRVNASLRNVQFVKDGEPFGEKVPEATQDFSAVEDDEDSGV